MPAPVPSALPIDLTPRVLRSERLQVMVDPELKQLVAERSDELNISESELAFRVLSAWLRPDPTPTEDTAS